MPCVLGYNLWAWDGFAVFGGAVLDFEDFLVSNQMCIRDRVNGHPVKVGDKMDPHRDVLHVDDQRIYICLLYTSRCV